VHQHKVCRKFTVSESSRSGVAPQQHSGHLRLMSRYLGSLVVFESVSAPFVLCDSFQSALWRRQADQFGQLSQVLCNGSE
jgi:hypothetical protein